MIPNIELNETSPVIAVLHKMMQLLHLKVDTKERMEQKAGEQTQNSIRNFQKENELPLDDKFVVDKPTINFMFSRLGQLGYLDSKMRRTISGKVHSSSGQVLHRVPLGAMDLDLPAISKYKVWKSTQELIVAQDTIEFLGLTESGQDGFYEITFYDWMYEKSERRSADVVVFALNNEDGRTGDQILGRSALFQNVGYHTNGVDIRIEEAIGDLGEYKPLFHTINALLEENKMELSSIFDSTEQISFVASELNIPLEKAQHIVQANALDYSIQENLLPELLYALGQQKITLDWESLHRSSIEVLVSAIAKAIAEKDIDTFSQVEIDDFIDKLKSVTASKTLEPKGDEPNMADELLTVALSSQNERIAFTKATNTYTGTDEDEFWEKYLPEQTDFKPDTIQSLRNNQKLFLLSETHLPLVRMVADVKDLSEMVQWDFQNWEQIVKKTGVPAHIEGETEDDKIKKYTTNIRNNINREYPTAAVHHKINNNELSVDSEVRQPINQFLSTAQGFDIKKSKIKDFQDDIDVVAGGNSAAVTKELKELQRLVRINPDTSLLQTLKDRGLTSAFVISEIPQKTFILQNSEFMGGEKYAKMLHANATFTTAKVDMVKNRFQTALESHVPNMIRSPKDREAIEAKINEHWPGYSEVFNVNSCECGHCNSVYGPAAYFVDLMRFLGLGFADEDDPKNPQKVFKDRRPDLFHLPLTCENSNTLIPYIDLANEVMENYIYYSEEDEIADDYNDYESADTGDLTEEELRAQPQNIRKETYLILAKTIFPFSLPFHLPLEILYAYFNQLGTSWHEVLDKTNDVSSEVIMRNLNAAYLQLSETEYALLSDEKFNSELEYSVPAINDFYGLSVTKFPDLSQVPVFLRQTGLAYTDLVQLLYTSFINPQLYKLEYLNLLIKEADVVGSDIYENLKALSENEGEGTIRPDILDSVSDYGFITESEFRIWITKNFESLKDVLTLYQPSSACDLSTTELKTLKSVHDILETVLPENILVRMHKFIRLWRKTSWSIQELDVILSAFGNVLIDTEGVNHISFAKQFIDSTNLSPKEAALLWGNFDYRRPNNLYATLFLKKSLKINNVFIPAPGKSLFTNLPIDKENLSNYMSDILAAFRISETTLDCILEHLGLTKTGRLTLENLSAIYRYKLFAESCDIKVQELVQHINLFNLSPFENPEMSVEAFTKIKKVESSDFTLETLGYIFGATEIDFTALVLKEEEIAKQSEILAEQYLIIEKQEIVVDGEETSEELESQLKRDFTYQQLGDFLSIPATLFKELAETEVLAETEIDNLIAADGADFNLLFSALVNKLHKAVATINGFSLEENEVDYFLSHPLDFSELDFNNMQAETWWRLYNYVTLKEQLPKSDFSLIDIFNYDVAEAPIAENFPAAIHLVTGWNKNDIEYLLTIYSSSDDFINEIILSRMASVISVSNQMGVTVQTLYSLGSVNTSADEDIAFTEFWDKSQIIKNVVKARYDESTWTTVATKLNDQLREKQRNALVAHLLNNPDIKEHPMEIKDADGLYEFFLIDVQMSSCMDTSRMVQASAAIQQFVNRVHLNLEEGISPDNLDRKRWEWMKHYRVWEAQMRVLYENYTLLKPEWRQDASPFFDDLVSHLTQNDITERTAEEAMRGYLKSMSEVANLNVAGSYEETYKDGKFKYLHVFGHTNHMPYGYYYRTWNEFGKWSAWEKVDAAIQPVVNTDDGGQPGVHLIPVVWKNRLLLFWPEFMEKTEAAPIAGGKNFRELAKDNVVAQTPRKYWEVRLVWSEYYDKKWTAKQVSDSFIDLYEDGYFDTNKLHEISFSSNVSDSEGLKIIMSRIAHHQHVGRSSDEVAYTFYRWYFNLNSISNEVSIGKYPNIASRLDVKCFDNLYLNNNYRYHFAKTTRRGIPLQFGNTYLGTSSMHQLLFPNQLQYHEHPLKYPFFYSASSKTYFIKRKYCNKELQILLDRLKNSKNLGEILVLTLFLGSVSSVLEFSAFHHPYVSDFISNLNRNGISSNDLEKPGLMESDIMVESENGKFYYDDEGVTFKNTFDPNYGLVYKPSDLDDPKSTNTYFKETIDFDKLGANSKYNWELFFHAPLHIATELGKNGKFKEAINWFHYIFDPTTDEVAVDGLESVSRFWKVKPFKTTATDDFEQFINGLLVSTDGTEDPTIKEWRENPFNPHLVASNFPDNYMKYTVLMYVQTLVDWGDSLYRKFTRENVYEAIQLYVIASHILGTKPPFVPKRGTIKKETFASIKERLTDLNAWVELENSLIYSSADNSTETGTDASSLLGSGLSNYFCIPPNEKLLQYWETVEDRLFKIRNCKDINGVTRRLALFAPPIDPAALIKAKSAGLNLSDILTNLNTPAPHYRFSYLLQKANEFCNDVKGLGNALLSAIEKQDGEALSRLRSTHEIEMLQMIQKVKERQIIDAQMGIKQLIKQRETAIHRFAYYNVDLLGNEPVEIPPLNELALELTDINQIVINSPIPERETDVSVGLVDSDESGLKVIRKEKLDFEKREKAKSLNEKAIPISAISGEVSLFPSITGQGEPFGVGISVSWGSPNIVSSLQAAISIIQMQASIYGQEASLASTTASYIRREQEWTHQANLVAREIGQIERQIFSAGIRQQIAQKELVNHKKQIENANTIEAYLKEKFTNKELYAWMKDQLKSLHKKSYDLAFEMARKAELAFQFEKGDETESYLEYDYWDSGKYGLLAGEKLQMALRQLDVAYQEKNTREFELTKHISLRRLNPIELLKLKVTGKIEGLKVPEWLFDIDCPGHYKRRIKRIGISIPAIAGPYTSVNCKLTLDSSNVRINPNLNSESLKPTLETINAIVTSNAQNDDGMFESNFRDERYLPFEGAGVISTWDLELPDFRQYDYNTISDVIIHISYTAVAEEGEFKKDVIAEYKSLLNNASEQGLFRLFDLKHDFPNEWHHFTDKETDNFEAILKEEHFPYYAPSPRRTIVDKKLYSIKPDGTLDPKGKIDLSSTEMRIEIERTDLVTELESFVIVRFTIDEKN